MKTSALWIGWTLATSMAVMQSALFPIVLLTYAPLIALCLISAPIEKALWLAALAGLCQDLLSTDPFGIYAMIATLITAFIYFLKLKLFKDEYIQLCFYTFLISILTMPLQLFFLFLFDRHLPIQGKSFFFDLLGMPLIDAMYAFIWFVGPLMILDWGQMQYKLWRLRRNGI